MRSRFSNLHSTRLVGSFFYYWLRTVGGKEVTARIIVLETKFISEKTQGDKRIPVARVSCVFTQSTKEMT